MSTGPETSVPEPDDLQFDHAEFEKHGPSSIRCAACKQPIEDQYFEINGTIVCDRCRSVIETQLRGGSKLVRLARAVLFGSAAALLGVVIYVSVIHFSHMDLALISIFVGYLVGRAVRSGSRNRGGLVYQLFAVGLTYFAIGMTYTSVAVIQSFQIEKLVEAKKAEARREQPAVAPKGAQPEEIKDAAPVEKAVIDAPGPQPADLEVMPSLLTLLMLLPLIFLQILQVPVFMMRENAITIAIVGFALWQAWKMNVPAKFVVTGPYRVGGIEPVGGRVANA